MKINSSFKNQVIESNIKYDDKLFLMCRSGVRSLNAAKFLISCGYNYSFNVSDGFEGDKNNRSQRSTINGWAYHNLPWKQ
jgi:rhodanese-related sulfurtransferase